ncbi:Uma2 family endonuclease [Streptomyces lacrimifluminis]|uniref:Putative restriction endonuclease domain-containing protein n=1 Tax=Streptomyces lacrimifluminis TaxID=1500077 RepID=A0A917NWS7_9ACTN|nr:Uma2 family endonuclease [Streptomyces lacrimifluminis]GGJ36191.1 hypothetical protein GCM10012282_36190 [Streptomyces lacrimifluminis]
MGWPIPPPESWTADDVDRIPDLPKHTELLDGSLVFVSPQTRFHQTWDEPGDVFLTVEVVAGDTRDRDREVKPRKYAAAGVAHFWRVEQDGDKGLPVVYVYELDPATKAYALTRIFHDRLELTAPFEIDIDLTVIDRRPGS